MSITKKGLLIGLCIGIIFGIYSNITNCHTSPGGPSGCDNSLQLLIAMFEFCLWIVPVLLLNWIPGFVDSTIGFKIILFIIPVVVFSLIGLFSGFAINKVKKHNTQRGSFIN